MARNVEVSTTVGKAWVVGNSYCRQLYFFCRCDRQGFAQCLYAVEYTGCRGRCNNDALLGYSKVVALLVFNSVANGKVYCILLALLAVFGLDKVIDISGFLNLPDGVAKVAALVVFALVIISLLKFSVWKKKKAK